MNEALRIEQNVRIPYRPRYPQTEIHPQLESHRFCVLVTHRQMGKTVCAVNHLIKQALLNVKQDPRYFYVAPFLKQAKMIAWDYLKRFTRPVPGVGVNEAELSVKLPNGAKITVFGADNEDALRGTYADGVVLDEYGDIKPNVWSEIIRPMLLSRNGWALFFGTPKGQNQFYDIYRRACREAAADPDGEWWAGLYRADETGVIGPEELKRVRAETPPHVFRQEYLCDFTADSDNVLIASDLVSQARGRAYRETDIRFAPRVIGADPARFGDDRSVIIRRQGLQAFPPIVLSKTDNMELAARMAREIQDFCPDAVFIDAGNGSGVIDRLRQLGFAVTEVSFGSAPVRAGRYANKRAEMWGELAEWLKAGGALPDDTDLAQDLSSACYDFDAAGRLRLEPKVKIKERLGRSPDAADALALTFAAPVCVRGAQAVNRARFANTDYDPYADL